MDTIRHLAKHLHEMIPELPTWLIVVGLIGLVLLSRKLFRW